MGLAFKYLWQRCLRCCTAFLGTAPRNRANWTIYNAFFRKGGVVTSDPEQLIARPTHEPEFAAMPPLMPQKVAWRELVMETTETGMAAASK